MTTQTVLVPSPMGLRPLHAPAGFEFDKTALHLWSRLLHVAQQRLKPVRIKRDGVVLDAQIEVLSIVIANSMGMAAWFWTQEAARIAPMADPKREKAGG